MIKKPAIIELNDNDDIIHVNYLQEYIDGNREKAKKLLKWMNYSEKEIYNIIWEWESGNDNFDLINNKINL